MSEWISVENKNPTTEGQVLCRYIKPFFGVPSEAFETMYFEDEKGWLYWFNDKPVGYPVTHWMPLPESPK